MKVRFPHEAALKVAGELLEHLTPLCDRVVIAGSLRRKKNEVGDVEIVYVPRFIEWPNPEDIFRQPVATNCVDHILRLLIDAGIIAQRLNSAGFTAWGASNKLAVHRASGIPVDFFATSLPCWWNYLVCRTGGARTNTAIASSARERGWKWNPTSEGFTRCSGPDSGRVRPMRSEREVFEFAGINYLEPEARQ